MYNIEALDSQYCAAFSFTRRMYSAVSMQIVAYNNKVHNRTNASMRSRRPVVHCLSKHNPLQSQQAVIKRLLSIGLGYYNLSKIRLYFYAIKSTIL